MAKPGALRQACPARDCSRGGPVYRIGPGEQALIPPADWVGDAKKCTYCSCVFVETYENGQLRKVIKGFLEDVKRGPGWYPYNPPAF